MGTKRVRTPQEKKTLSLERDRRNVYGESTKGTRVGIPRSKQQSKQAERRVAKQPLQTLTAGSHDDQSAFEAQDTSLAAGLRKRRKGFRKSPDQPLGKVLRFKKVELSSENS